MAHEPEQCDAAMAEARTALARGDSELALRAARCAAEFVGSSDPLRLATCFDLLGDVQQRRGEPDEARSSYSAAIHLYRQIGSHVGVANVDLSLGFLSERTGAYNDAQRHFERALHGYREAGRDAGQAQARLGLGMIATTKQERVQAAEHYLASREHAQRAGSAQDAANAEFRLAELQSEEDPERGLSALQEACRTYASLNDPIGYGNALFALAKLYGTVADRAGSEAHLNQAMAVFRRCDAAYGLARCFDLRAEVAVAAGDLSSAHTAWLLCEQESQRAGRPRAAALAAFRRIQVLYLLGRPREALEQASELQPRLSIGDPALRAAFDDWLRETSAELSAGAETLAQLSRPARVLLDLCLALEGPDRLVSTLEYLFPLVWSERGEVAPAPRVKDLLAELSAARVTPEHAPPGSVLMIDKKVGWSVLHAIDAATRARVLRRMSDIYRDQFAAAERSRHELAGLFGIMAGRYLLSLAEFEAAFEMLERALRICRRHEREPMLGMMDRVVIASGSRALRERLRAAEGSP